MTDEAAEAEGTAKSVEQMSDEELLAAIQAPADEPTEAVELEAEPESAEEVEESEPTDPTVTEAAEEAEPAQQAEEIGAEDAEREKLMLRLEELELDRKHFESVAGSNAGKVGFLERKLKTLSEELEVVRSRPQTGQSVEDASPESAILRKLEDLERKVAAPRVVEADSNAISMAIQAAGQEFQSEVLTPEVLEDKALSKVEQENLERAVAELRQSPPDTTHILASGDTEYAKVEVRRLLSRAYVKVKRDRIAARRKELDSKTVDQAAGLKQKKRAASISRSSGGSAAPKRKVLNPETMPIEDLGKLIDRMGKQGL